MNLSLSNLRDEMTERVPALLKDSSPNDVMLCASLYIKELERIFATLPQQGESVPAETPSFADADTVTTDSTTLTPKSAIPKDIKNSPQTKSTKSTPTLKETPTTKNSSRELLTTKATSTSSATPASPAILTPESVSLQYESPKVNGDEKEALIPFGSPHSALREINRNLAKNAIPEDEEGLVKLLDENSFLLDLLQ